MDIIGGKKNIYKMFNEESHPSSVVDFVPCESRLNPAGSAAKALLPEHQQHTEALSPNESCGFKSSREMVASTRGKIESDKSVLNSV